MKTSSRSRKNHSSTLVVNDPRYTRKEAADYLNVVPGTLAVWASTGRVAIPYCKIGKKVVYRKSDLDAFIADNMRGGKVA